MQTLQNLRGIALVLGSLVLAVSPGGALPGALSTVPHHAAASSAGCDGTVRATAPSPQDPERDFCVVAARTVGNLDAGEAVAVAGALSVDDSGSRVDLDQRAFLNVQLRCFVTAVPGGQDRLAFSTSAVRNVFTGMHDTTIRPRGVLVARTSGDYRCVLDARQYDVSTNGTPRDWAVGSAALTADIATHGASTSGPDSGPWPATEDDITPIDGTTASGMPVTRLEVHPGEGTSSVSITTSVPLSTCAYHSPDTDACWPSGARSPALDPARPFRATVLVRAEQHSGTREHATCGTPLVDSEPATVTALIHHLTVTATHSFALDPRCSGAVTISINLRDVEGRGYVGTAPLQHGTAGKAYQESIGATWR